MNSDEKGIINGKWLELTENEYCRFQCSNCGHRRVSIAECNFCPQCGADMRGSENNDITKSHSKRNS